MIYGFRDEEVALLAGDLAVNIVNHLVAPDEVALHFGEGVKELINTADRVAFGPSTQAILDEAASRDIPYLRLDKHSLVQMGQGVHQKQIRTTITTQTYWLAHPHPDVVTELNSRRFVHYRTDRNYHVTPIDADGEKVVVG